jgi:hypothetical protein
VATGERTDLPDLQSLVSFLQSQCGKTLPDTPASPLASPQDVMPDRKAGAAGGPRRAPQDLARSSA